MAQLYIYIYIYVYIYILFHILSHDGLSQDIEYNSLCYTVGLVVHPFYIYQFASADPQIPIPPSSSPWQPQVCLILENLKSESWLKYNYMYLTLFLIIS